MPHARLFDREEWQDVRQDEPESILAAFRRRIELGVIDQNGESQATHMRSVENESLMECVQAFVVIRKPR